MKEKKKKKIEVSNRASQSQEFPKQTFVYFKIFICYMWQSRSQGFYSKKVAETKIVYKSSRLLEEKVPLTIYFCFFSIFDNNLQSWVLESRKIGRSLYRIRHQNTILDISDLDYRKKKNRGFHLPSNLYAYKNPTL